MANNLPVKSREMSNHHFDSTKWNDFPIRDDDIIVTTAYKSGTTWVQNMILQLLYQGREIPPNTLEQAPWLDLRQPPIAVQRPLLESLTERRCIKTHLRLDALVFSPKAKYIYVGRDGRDCYMSLINHYRCGNEHWYGLLDSPGLIGPQMPRFSEEEHGEKALFDKWISQGWETLEGETDGWPFWSLFDQVATWWEYRHLPNILFIHYGDLLEDPAGGMREIAAFLEIPIQEQYMEHMLQATSMEGMRKELHAIPAFVFKGGAAGFVNKGTNGRWKGVLTEEQLAKYDAKVREKFTPECALWLEGGKKGFNPKSGI